MSRNVYTFAVVSPSLESELLGRLGGERDARERAAGDLIRDRLEAAGRPQVAYYREVMDGWNRTHGVHEGRLLRFFPAAAGLLEQLTDRGWWHGPAGFDWGDPTIDRRRLVRELAPRREAPSHYGLSAFVLAMVDLIAFQRATGCPAFCLWRCVGAVCDDAEFSAGS